MNNKESSQALGSFSEVMAEDRALDLIGQGQSIDHDVESSDQLYALFSAARAEADANIPAPPLLADLLGEPALAGSDSAEDLGLDVIPLHKKRRGLLGRRAGAAMAAGGVSITSMLVAGGVAAALAVGGLGYAAYTTTQPRGNESDTARQQESTQSVTNGFNSAGTSAGSTGDSAAKPSVEQAPDRPGRGIGAAELSSDKPESSEEKQERPAPDAQHLAGGEQNINDPAFEGLEGQETQESASTMTETTGQDQTAPAVPANPDAGGLRPQVEAPAQPAETEETASTEESESTTANQGQGQLLQQQESPGQQSPAGSTDTRY